MTESRVLWNALTAHNRQDSLFTKKGTITERFFVSSLKPVLPVHYSTTFSRLTSFALLLTSLVNQSTILFLWSQFDPWPCIMDELLITHRAMESASPPNTHSEVEILGLILPRITAVVSILAILCVFVEAGSELRAAKIRNNISFALSSARRVRGTTSSSNINTTILQSVFVGLRLSQISVSYRILPFRCRWNGRIR